MWIVALALRRPYTFVVMALLILILSPIVILRTPTDIFPDINIPVISIVWNYTGLAPQDMSDRITSVTERALTTLVNDIDHIESQSLNGIAVVKVFFRPNANIQTALAQVTAISQTQIKQLPAGTTPPLIIQYSASSVPIVQIGLSSTTEPEQKLFDYATNFIRTQLITIPGAAIPWPYGGKQRQIQVDIDTAAMQAKHLTPVDVVNAISAQNLILPKTRRPGISSRDECQPQDRRRAKRSAGEDGERCDDLHSRRGACARRIFAANQHCPPGRDAWIAHYYSEER
jgi:multidrug efflux pump subunit AcrB